MSSARSWLPVATVVVEIAAAVGCNTNADPAIVDYGDSTPIGSWAPEAAQNTAGNGSAQPVARPSGADQATAGISANVLGAPVDDTSPVYATAGSPSGAVSGTPQTSAGTGAPAASDAGAAALGGSGGSETSGSGGTASNTAGARAAGSGSGGAGANAGAGGTETQPTSVTQLTFDVTTSPVGYQYQPKNVGAIWIEDTNGTLVKSLEVWANTRRRYLTRYVGALSGSSIDVTASATLQRHRTHQVSWDLRDKSGRAVAPGVYTLVMELTDGDLTGRNNSVMFDTRSGPATLSPADAPSFGAMTLQLQ